MRLATSWALLAISGLASTDISAYTPAVNFQLQCMGCHLADGSGENGRVPSLRRSLVEFSAFPAGREFVIRVPGVAQAPLSDAEVAALLNWLAHNRSDVPLPADFPEFTAAEVGRQRSRPLANVRSVRECLLRAVDQEPAGRGARRPDDRRTVAPGAAPACLSNSPRN